MSIYKHARKGIYKPLNESKWVGDKIIYRSMLERKWFHLFDTSVKVKKIASERVIIPYYDKVSNKVRRYYVDLLVSYIGKDGSEKVKLIEIKSFIETVEPKKPKRINNRYKTAIATWITNSCKWEAARQYCKKRNWEFVILTEKDL